MKHIITGLTLSLWTFSALFAQEQKTYPEQEPMGPKMTEYWTPQPKVVTPGDILTNTAPSDAIVLFDGKNLSQWTNGKGGDADLDLDLNNFGDDGYNDDEFDPNSFGIDDEFNG